MRNILKIFVLSIVTVSCLNAIAIDDKIIDFEKKRFLNNKKFELKDVQLYFKKELPTKEWYGFILNIDANFQGKPVKFKDVLFSNGFYIAPELIDASNGESLKNSMTITLSSEYYRDENLIAGNKDAKDKIVVFSDPLCPYCMDYVPDVIKYVKKHEKTVGLYYYHFPLIRIHPASEVLCKIMDVAQKKGIKDILLKVYEADWDKYFTESEKDEAKILSAFNKEFSTNITSQEINSTQVSAKISHDISMGDDAMVQGTPTIFVNGELDKTKTKFQEVGKE
ncbi:MAG: DsbA family protein [Candidatus Marinarcus sp.]|uniref:DsbA family protein n=1 Tax=Candidatus Marinarcus sp. TaxID=3100987 RepID=UPI003B007D28